MEILDQEDNNWRETTVLLIDNASYHRSKKLFKFYKKLKIPVMFMAPYSPMVAPIELLFSYLKSGNLNSARLKWSKK